MGKEMQTEVKPMTKPLSVLIMKVVHFRPVHSPDNWPEQRTGREDFKNKNQQIGERQSHLLNQPPPPPPNYDLNNGTKEGDNV